IKGKEKIQSISTNSSKKHSFHTENLSRNHKNTRKNTFFIFRKSHSTYCYLTIKNKNKTK
ncbi:hypothetical protein, partial [Vibrio parahaemolyticus]|uniref:hypothetical protein n=1 Tax=Vibrio parahaemolyticus TaxID=670 RepID=UPI001EDC402C